MAESEKGKASSSKEKDISSDLDEDISKSFLGSCGSWDAILGSDNGSMDFKFEPATKGKKKEFNFDKLDMDFSLDGDFDKIKSFKADMGDLDFSSPPKTSTKSKETNLDFSSPPKDGTRFKERLEGGSAKNNRGSEDCFAFSFDFNELDKFDLDAVLPTKTKGKDDGKRMADMNSADKHEHHNSEMKLADTDARGDGGPKEKSMSVKKSNSKENLVPCKDILDSFPERDPSESSTLENQLGSKHSKTFLGGENIGEKSQAEMENCHDTYDEPQLPNRTVQTVQDQAQSEPASINSAEDISDHPQGTDCKHSNETPKVHNQSAWSYMDNISLPNVSEQTETTSTAIKSGNVDSKMQALPARVYPPLQMETTSAGNKFGNVNSKMQALPAKVDTALTSENLNLQVKEKLPQYDSKSLPEAESESYGAEKNVSKYFNRLGLGMDRAAVVENVPHVVKKSGDLSNLGDRVAEPIPARKKAHVEVSSSTVPSFTLKPTVQDKPSAPTKTLPSRSNLISLRRNAISVLHQSPSGARHDASSRSTNKFENKSASLTEETTVSENNMKIVSDQSIRKHCNAKGTQMTDSLGVLSVLHAGKAADIGTVSQKKNEDIESSRKHCNAMGTQMTDNLSVLSMLNDGQAADRGTKSEKKKEDTISSSKSGNEGSEKLKPKIPSLQSVRKLKMDTIVGKLSTLKVSQKLPSFSGLRISSTPVLEEETVTAKKMDNIKMNVAAKTGNQQSPAPSIKRKITEASDAAAPVMLHPSKRVFANQNRNTKEDSQGVTQKEVGFHQITLDRSLNSDSYKQPESALEIPYETKFSGVGVTSMLENENTIEKAEACGKELDRMCSMLRKKQEEAKELLVRVLVTNNKILLLGDPMQTQKFCQVQIRTSRLTFRELPGKLLVPSVPQ